jgi:hypothetical protein
VDMLARCQVAVYPIDPRGVMTDPLIDASRTNSRYATNPTQFGKDEAKAFSQTASEHGTMDEMARATGGKAFENTNDLKAAIGEAVEAGSNYYTVAYTPANHNWNGSYRKIQVKIDRPNVALAYRHGYFADSSDTPSHRSEPHDAKPGPAPASAILAAMQRGAPDPTQIIFLADVRPSSTATEDAPAKGNQLGHKASAPFRRYTVTYVINPNQVSCGATPDGVHHCLLEFRTFVYDPDGVLVNMQANGIKADLNAADYAEQSKRNLAFAQEISVPVKGEYYLRIGVRDGSNDRVGALELPVAAVAKLPPPAASEAAPSGPATAPAAPAAK